MSNSNAITFEQLDDKQRLSVERALDTTSRIAATTGPAGSGKTTIMRFVYQSLVDAGYNPVFCAPTGKAARRVREATGFPCKTIHMLLEYTAPQDIDEKTGKPFGDTFPRRTREHPLDHDVVIVDEFAMVTHELHRNLVDALPNGARLIVYGDTMQLPPIEQSSALATQPTSFQKLLDKFNGVYLERVHRTDGDSGILAAAQRVLRGLAPVDNNDFKRIITEQPVDKLLEEITLADYASLDNQIITPSNKSWIGTHKLNQALQIILMPDTNERTTLNLPRNKWDKGTVRVGAGDKVIMTKNWYDLDCEDATKGIFNGEVGIVTEISEVEEVVVDFGDRVCRIPPAIQSMYNNSVYIGYPQRDMQLAYATTTHKTQGSEYKNVIYVINKSVITMLNRKNMYTAITRAREKVTMITDMKGLSMSVTCREPKVFGE